MRIGIGGIAHETNAFSNVATDETLFRKLAYLEGQEILEKNTGVRSYMGGYIDEAKAQGITLVPALFANANPSGRIPTHTLETLRDRLVDMLWAEHQKQPLDAIALNCHGAGASVGYPDIEGEILRAVRERFGWEIPVSIVLDLHANVTGEMVEYSDVLVGVKCYPHVDMYESARVTMELLANIVRTGKRLYKRLITLPWHFAPTAGVTLSGPAHKIQQLTIRLEQEIPELKQVTFFHGFPYADIPHCHVAVTAMAETQEAADAAALEVARTAWNDRYTFRVPTLSPAEAFDKAQQAEAFPVVINESSDNPGGGAPGDGTFLLREMLKRNLPGSAFGHICDPEVAQLAAKAGVGSTISCLLGAKTDKLHGEPIALENAYVKAICDGRFVNVSPMGGGGETNLDLSVRLQVGNVDIVVSSRPRQTMCKGPFEMVGINYTQMRYLGLKSSQHFKGWWKDHAGAIITCDPPGIHCGNLSVFDFQYADRNYFPFVDLEWEPEL